MIRCHIRGCRERKEHFCGETAVLEQTVTHLENLAETRIWERINVAYSENQTHLKRLNLVGCDQTETKEVA